MRDDYGVYGPLSDDQYVLGDGDYGTSVGQGQGPGLDEIIGALLNPANAGAAQALQNPAVRQALAQRVAARQPVIRRVPPTQWRKWVTGLGPLYIAAGGTGTITIQPQLLFKVKKIYLTDVSTGTGVAAGYASSVTGITVGQQNQLPNNTVIPTWSFGIGALENAVDFDTCQGAYTMTLTFSTIAACTITGSLWGLAIKNS